MAYVFLTDLDVALSNAGIAFTAIDTHPADATGSSSWQERGRPESTGGFQPTGTLCHHTASPAGTSDAAEINALMAGNSEAPGPISQIFIGRGAGTVYLLAAGRANHGGRGMRPGIDSQCADMNNALLGIEAGNNGIGESWSDAQTLNYARVVAALHVHYHWPKSAIFLHATTGPPNGGCNSKIDPAGPWQRQPDIGASTWDLETWRNFCAEQVFAPIPEDDEVTPIGFITCNAGTVGHHVDGSTYTVPVDGTTFYVMPGGGLQWMRDPNQLSTKVSVIGGAGLRTDTWNTPVGDPDVFGILAGPKPG